MEVFRKTDRIGNLVLKILQFLVADALSVGDVDQNNLQRLIQVVGFDEVIFVVILVINQKQAVFVLRPVLSVQWFAGTGSRDRC